MLVVWDFDLTITQIHTCQPIRLQESEAKSRPLDSLVADPDFFGETCAQLTRDGHALAVASYGRKEIIRAILDRLGVKVPDSHIVTPKTIEEWTGCRWPEGYEPPRHLNKSVMLDYLRTLDGWSREEILLVDDSALNVHHATLHGYRAIHAREPYGKRFLEREKLDPSDIASAWRTLMEPSRAA